jgi:flagellar biosynthesis/type III secretory pathway protein FliH
VADVDDEALRTTVAQLGPAAEEVTVTAAERLRREGLDEGLRKGRDEGLRKGRDEGRRTQAAMLVSMLEARFGAVPDDVRARIEAADTETLERWGVRLVTADALEDVLD